VPFHKSARDRVTILFGGVTRRQERLLCATVSRLGYKVACFPTPDKEDFQAGREFGNAGMCSPAHFIAGALVRHLQRLRDEHGLTPDYIVRHYAYANAGACGPCRFGMYESECRLVLRNAGFGDLPVLSFQQKDGLAHADGEAGLNFDEQFFMAFLSAILICDALNELYHQLKPYELEKGATDQVFDKVMDYLCGYLAQAPPPPRAARPLARLTHWLIPDTDRGQLETILENVLTGFYVKGLKRCAEIINEELEVDYSRPAPLVKVIGEFWAQTTEGDGNFRMFEFLEKEGAEVAVEPIMTWMSYLVDVARCRAVDRRGATADPLPPYAVLSHIRNAAGYGLSRLRIALIDYVFHRQYNRIRKALGGVSRPQTRQATLRRLAAPYYDHRLMGGEGHLEIGKAIYFGTGHLCHMLVGLKPFGCLPSTQSDAAMAAVAAHHPEILYVPIETSGEGDVNAYSRVQMTLTEAKQRCKEEHQRALDEAGLSPEAVQRLVTTDRELRRPLRPIPRHPHTAGTAANFIRHLPARLSS